MVCQWVIVNTCVVVSSSVVTVAQSVAQHASPPCISLHFLFPSILSVLWFSPHSSSFPFFFHSFFLHFSSLPAAKRPQIQLLLICKLFWAFLWYFEPRKRVWWQLWAYRIVSCGSKCSYSESGFIWQVTTLQIGCFWKNVVISTIILVICKLDESKILTRRLGTGLRSCYVTTTLIKITRNCKISIHSKQKR